MYLDISIRDLQYIIEVYRCSSINKAAQNCYISQSYLSKIITKVETTLGYQIMERNRGGIQFTRNGLYFLDSAERIVSEGNKIEKIPQINGDNRSMSVACSPSGSIIKAFLEFRKPAPNSSHDHEDVFKECGIQEIVQNVAMNEMALGILVIFTKYTKKYASICANRNMSFDLIASDIPVNIMMSKNHPLAQKEYLEVKDIAGYPFVFDSNIDYDETSVGILNIAKSPNALITCNRASRIDAVKSGYYLCHSSILSIPDLDEIVEKQVEGLNETLSVYAIKNYKRSYTIREFEFLNFLKQRLSAELRTKRPFLHRRQ